MSSAVGDEIVSRDGTTIGVWRSGDGPPLVLVHGAAADHSRWAPVLPALEQRFTVLAIDRRGRGASGDAGDYEIEREYEDLAEVVASVGEEAAVLGHSYGGICALECALLTAGHDSPRRAGEQGVRLRSQPLSNAPSPDVVSSWRREQRSLQGGRGGGTGGAAGVPRRGHARSATRRHGHRHRALHRRGTGLSRR